MDVDVVVAVVGRGWRAKLVSGLKRAGLVVDEKRIDDALKSGYGVIMFKDSKSPLTVDIVLSGVRLERRAGSILGLPTFYQKPEDLILTKLRMVKATVPRERALKDVDDVKSVLEFTRVNVEAVREKARKDRTLSILEGIMMEEEV